MALSQLPVELIQHIAAQCTGPEILVLSQVSRHLREVCNDSSVFQRSFYFHIPELTSPTFADKGALVRFLKSYIDGPVMPVPGKSQKETWCQVAVSVARLGSVKIELKRISLRLQGYGKTPGKPPSKKDRERFTGILGFLSSMAVWGYPHLCDAEVGTILDSLCVCFFSTDPAFRQLSAPWSLGVPRFQQFAFCLALASIQPPAWLRSEHDTIVTDAQSSTSAFPGHISMMRAVIAAFSNGRFHDSWEGWPTHSLLLIVLVAHGLRYWEMRGHSDGRSLLPSPGKIELLGPEFFVGRGASDSCLTTTSCGAILPLPTPILAVNGGSGRGRYLHPFINPSWNVWYKQHVEAMAGRIDQGEWYGYFTYGFRYDDPVSDAMERIRFQIIAEDSDSYTVEAVDCSDFRGLFSFSGRISRSHGAVRLRKQYSGDRMQNFRGKITPLGICGCYTPGTEEDTAFSGAFWLWKREWMDG